MDVWAIRGAVTTKSQIENDGLAKCVFNNIRLLPVSDSCNSFS